MYYLKEPIKTDRQRFDKLKLSEDVKTLCENRHNPTEQDYRLARKYYYAVKRRRTRWTATNLPRAYALISWRRIEQPAQIAWIRSDRLLKDYKPQTPPPWSEVDPSDVQDFILQTLYLIAEVFNFTHELRQDLGIERGSSIVRIQDVQEQSVFRPLRTRQGEKLLMTG